MAKNRVRHTSHYLSVACTNPTTPASGDPVRLGARTGVALTNESEGGNASGNTSVDFGPRVWDLSVKGVNDSGNSAVAVGDAIYYVDADTPKLSKKASGYFFGFALEAVGSGQTDTINVAKADSPGSGTLSAGGVGTTQLADEAVTAAKLSNQLAVGFIPLPLAQARLIASNDIPASGAADGGIISQDTAPKLERVNDATDKKLRIVWASSSNIEITWDFPYPNDLDDAADVVVHLLMKMAAGGMDTPTVAVGYFEGVGDTNAGGNTASLSTTLAEKTVTILAADIGAAPSAASVTVAPGTHTNEAAELYGAWVTYSRAANS